MKKTIESLISLVFIALIALAFFYSLSKGIQGSEKVECQKWMQESKQYPGWYSTAWQREQCKEYGITLPR